MEGDREGWEDGARVDEAGYREREGGGGRSSAADSHIWLLFSRRREAVITADLPVIAGARVMRQWKISFRNFPAPPRAAGRDGSQVAPRVEPETAGGPRESSRSIGAATQRAVAAATFHPFCEPGFFSLITEKLSLFLL